MIAWIMGDFQVAAGIEALVSGAEKEASLMKPLLCDSDNHHSVKYIMVCACHGNQGKKGDNRFLVI
mgnify:FL=1